jgi:hypothetical protein
VVAEGAPTILAVEIVEQALVENFANLGTCNTARGSTDKAPQYGTNQATESETYRATNNTNGTTDSGTSQGTDSASCSTANCTNSGTGTFCDTFDCNARGRAIGTFNIHLNLQVT